MQSKSIMLIDEDEVVLSLLQKNLIGHNPNHKIVTASTPEAAVQVLKAGHFDLIIADLQLIAFKENHLLEILRSQKTKGAAMIATAYNYQRVMEVNIGDLTGVHLIPKPIKSTDLQNAMRRVLGKPTEAILEKPQGSEEAFRKISVETEQLRGDIHARCILLSDTVGNIVYRAGNLDEIPLEAITSLLCGGIATLVEAGKNLDEQDVMNLAYREGKNSDLYAINLGSQWVLIIVIDRGQYYERLGSVWYHARKAAVRLEKLLKEASPGKTTVNLGGAVEQAYSDELDKLFG